MSFDIVSELKKYKPNDVKEAQNVENTLRFIDESGSLEEACDRWHGSHLTGSAFVVDRSGKILLNHHKKANMWLHFGGHCDNETDILAVALREAVEETGINEESINLPNQNIFYCGVYDIPENRTAGEPAHKHYDISFLVQVDDTHFNMSNESVELRWCDADEAIKLVEDDEAMLKMIEKSRVYFK